MLWGTWLLSYILCRWVSKSLHAEDALACLPCRTFYSTAKAWQSSKKLALLFAQLLSLEVLQGSPLSSPWKRYQKFPGWTSSNTLLPVLIWPDRTKNRRCHYFTKRLVPTWGAQRVAGEKKARQKQYYFEEEKNLKGYVRQFVGGANS